MPQNNTENRKPPTILNSFPGTWTSVADDTTCSPTTRRAEAVCISFVTRQHDVYNSLFSPKVSTNFHAIEDAGKNANVDEV